MQASFLVFFRATVMLACLVVLPLIAVTGSADLERLRPALRWCRGLVERTLTGAAVSAAESSADRPAAAPPFRSLPVSVDANVERPSPPVERTIPADVLPAQAPASAPASAPAPPVGPRPTEQTAGATGGEPRGDGPTVQQLAARLQQLGATYYLLEKWGETGALYRFHCRVALADNPQQFRYFEATSQVPHQAMVDVVAQVERWRESLMR